MGAMVECLRPDSGMEGGRTEKIKLWGEGLLGWVAVLVECVAPENSDFLAAANPARTESFALGRGIKNAGYIK